MKNIINIETCQTELTTQINNRSIPEIEVVKPAKPKKFRRTREELANRTREEASRSYSRKGPKATKKIREELNATYPPRNSFTFKTSWYVTPCNYLPPKNNINNINTGKRKKTGGVVYDSMSFAPHKSPYFDSSLSPDFKNQSPVPVKTNWTEKKEEKIMQANPIRESIRNLTMLNLSKWGQIKLMAYPDQSIQYAYSQLQHANPRDPFAWFVSLCLKYCKENQLAPDWTGMLSLSRQYSMPDNAKMTLGPLIKPVQTVSTGIKKKWQPAVAFVAAEKPEQYNAALRANPMPKYLVDAMGSGYVDASIANNLDRWHEQKGHIDCGCPLDSIQFKTVPSVIEYDLSQLVDENESIWIDA